MNIAKSERNHLDILIRDTDIIRTFQTPRDVIRLYNRLLLSAPNSKSEVAFSDLIAFETLELKYNKITQLIRKKPEKFIANYGSDEELYSNSELLAPYYAFADEDKDEEDNLNTLFTEIDYPQTEKEKIKSILMFLFPKLDRINIQEHIPKDINRIYNRDAFFKLLHCGVTSITYSKKEGITVPDCAVPAPERV